MNIGLPLADCRRVEVLANGPQPWQGAQVAVDTTLVCPVSRDGTARPGAAQAPGSAAQQAAQLKRRVVYPGLVAAQWCKLVVLGFEVGGRLDAEAAGFIRRLAASKARGAPARLRKAVLQASVHRWTGMLAEAAQRAYALMLLELPVDAADECDGTGPPLAEVLADARAAEPVVLSRLPAPGRAR